MTRYFDLVPGYESLATVYDSAIEQASEGKGRERHAEAGEPYERQIICEVSRRVGLGYPLGQATKKIYESQRLGGERGVAELLGALNYVAAAVIVMREGMETVPEANYPENPDSSTEASAEPEFKPGDRVQFRVTLPSVSDRIWVDGTYARYDRGCAFPHAVYNDAGHEENVKEEDIRPAPKADEESGFKRGDKVQAFNGEEWVDCRYIRWKEPEGRHVVQYKGCMCAIDPEDLRPVSRAEGCEEPAYNPDDDVVGGVVTLEWPRGKILEKRYASGRNEKRAEGCEALVEKDAPLCGERCEEFIPGLGTCESCRHAREQDAPQTPQELCKRIIDANPATFHTPSYAEEQLEHHSRLQAHKPTGEELAEAEEKKHG